MAAILKKHFRNRKIAMVAISVFLIGVIITVFQVLSLNQLVHESTIRYSNSIDVVYTWVNGSDQKFIEKMKKYQENINMARFDDKNEMKFSLRSLEKYAPWVRHVYIVTNGQIPSWLNLEYEKVSIIPHDQLAQDPEILPTFSSSVIEQFLHRIPNLSKRFLYLNDDVFLGSELYPEDLYTPTGGIHVYTTPFAPDCAPLCPWGRLKDGVCDEVCNVAECEFDGNDCVAAKRIRKIPHNIQLDDYLRSLINTSKIFNFAYGLKMRNIVPHSGFLFDKDIMEEMLVKFGKEFKNSRYNKFETINDVLVPYAFYHYLMSELSHTTAEDVFDSFDLDKSKIWSNDEVKLLLGRLYSKPLTKTNARKFDALLLNCFKNSSYGIDIENSEKREITRDVIINCKAFDDIFDKTFSTDSKHQFELTNERGSINSFILLTSNITAVTTSLNQLRQSPKKFNCINDNLRQDDTEEVRGIVKRLLNDFYTSLFPSPSKFENPEFDLNPYGYYEDYLKWKTRVIPINGQ